MFIWLLARLKAKQRMGHVERRGSVLLWRRPPFPGQWEELALHFMIALRLFFAFQTTVQWVIDPATSEIYSRSAPLQPAFQPSSGDYIFTHPTFYDQVLHPHRIAYAKKTLIEEDYLVLGASHCNLNSSLTVVFVTSGHAHFTCLHCIIPLNIVYL